MQIKDIMTKNVITVKPSLEIQKLAELFIEKDISGAPVEDEQGNFLGLVLEGGLLFQDKKVHLPTFLNLSVGILPLGVHRYEQEMKKIAASKVEDIMEKNVTVFSPETMVEEVATMMIEKNIDYCPVLENNKLVGVVTKKDIIRIIAKGKR